MTTPSFPVNRVTTGLFLLFGFCLPFSVAFCYLLLGLLVLGGIFKGDLRGFKQGIRGNYLIYWCLCWLLLHTLGVGWTEDYSGALTPWKKSLYLSTLPILMSCISIPYLRAALNSFVSGIFIYHLLTHGILLGWWSIEPMQAGGTPFINRVQYSPMLVFAMLLLFWLQRNWSPAARVLSWVIQISFAASLIATGGRTGQILLLVLIPLWILLETRSWKIVVGACVGLGISITILFLTVETFSSRILELKRDLVLFQSQITHSSLGERLHHIDAGIRLFSQSPYYGHGTGSYREKHQTLLKEFYPPGTINSDHPHNQYLVAMVQFGLPGLIILLALFPILLRIYVRWPTHPYRSFLVLLPTMFLLLCFTDESLYSVPSLTFFIYMSTILYHPDWSELET
jgi:O-antigen ligase